MGKCGGKMEGTTWEKWQMGVTHMGNVVAKWRDLHGKSGGKIVENVVGKKRDLHGKCEKLRDRHGKCGGKMEGPVWEIK